MIFWIKVLYAVVRSSNYFVISFKLIKTLYAMLVGEEHIFSLPGNLQIGIKYLGIYDTLVPLRSRNFIDL